MILPDNQKSLVNKLENEYEKYLSELESKSKLEIICESEQTTFYGHLLFYLREKLLTGKQIEALSQKNSLKEIYLCYMKNDYNMLDTINNFGKVIYQYTKEQNQSQM